MSSRKYRKSGKTRKRRKNPSASVSSIAVSSLKDLTGLSSMIGEVAGDLAISQACDGMTFEHKMAVSALIGTYIRPLLGYPKNTTITMTDENTEDTVSPG